MWYNGFAMEKTSSLGSRFSFIVKKGVLAVLKFLGINRNSKYVNSYIKDANVRSTVYMAAVILVLEVWLVYYQYTKAGGLLERYASGKSVPGFDTFFSWCSNFVLFFLLGLALLIYSATHRMKNRKKRMILNIIFSGINFGWTWFIFKEAQNFKWESVSQTLSSALLIAIYVISMIISINIIGESIFTFKKNRTSSSWTMAIIVLFATMCLAFGIKISYGDYINSNPKQMICFFTMVIFAVCLIIWRPFISILMNIAIFVGFYQLLLHAELPETTAAVFRLKDGDFVNYTTFVISLTMVAISIYHQRLNEAVKDEELEYIAHYDELTGLHNAAHVSRVINEDIKNDLERSKDKAILFVNVFNFKTYNDQRGFEAGDAFLKRIGELMKEEFPKGLVARQSDDHYIIYTTYADFEPHINSLNEKIRTEDKEIDPQIHVGVYRINKIEESIRAIDKARYACSTLGNDLTQRFVEYDLKMHQGYHQMQYVIHNIDRAVNEGWIRPYYQPVVWSKDGELCGVEALARWVDPVRGLLAPYVFVRTLEETKLIHKLDICILEQVCRDIRNNLDKGLPVVSASINFSRIDFEVIDVVEVLESIVKKYNIPKELLHVEVTESALSDSESVLARSVRAIKEHGYHLWLDDFGSGYSSLNVLKDYDFDVLKIDMKFLSGFDDRPKAKPLISAVVSMAEKLGMHTVCEGVETKEQMDFLSSADCDRLQGYLFGKPIPLADLLERIEKGEFKVSKNLS